MFKRLSHHQNTVAGLLCRFGEVCNGSLPITVGAPCAHEGLEGLGARLSAPSAEPRGEPCTRRSGKGGKPLLAVAAKSGHAAALCNPSQHVDHQLQPVAGRVPIARFQEDAADTPRARFPDPACLRFREGHPERVKRRDAEHGDPPLADLPYGRYGRGFLPFNREPRRILQAARCNAFRHAARHPLPRIALECKGHCRVRIIPAEHIRRVHDAAYACAHG